VGPQKGLIMKITIHVTGEHAELGAPNKPQRCPIALAIDDHPRFQFAWVDRYVVKFTDPYDRVRWTLPATRAVTKYVDAIDHGERPGPTVLRLDTATGKAKPMGIAGQSTKRKVKVAVEREGEAEGKTVIKTKVPQRTKISYRATVDADA